jgi:peptidoglycan/LPS O-acetylase OafA/YrhL
MRRLFASFFPSAALPATTPANVTAAIHPLSARLDFLDGLRGIAALAVFLAHAGSKVSPAFRTYLEPYFNLGSWGVVLFFLCSGFILPVSLERQGSLGRFWIRRFFRLYPLYWINVVIMAMIGPGEPRMVLSGRPAQSIQIFLANLSMFQAFMGIPHLMALYWTLTLELLFYILLSLLFLLKLNTRISYATLALIMISIGAELVIPLPFAFSYSTHLILILVGLVAYRHYSGALRPAVGVAVALLTPLMLLIPLLVDPRDSQQQLSWVIAQVVACAWFGAAYLLRARPVHPLFRHLGKISYSIYLMHTIVLDSIPQMPTPALSLLVWLVALLLLSSATYQWIEQPMIAWGQRLTRPALAQTD